MASNEGSFSLKLYFYDKSLISKGVIVQLISEIVIALNKISVKHCISKITFRLISWQSNLLHKEFHTNFSFITFASQYKSEKLHAIIHLHNDFASIS